ncbi:hypothetical protein AURDEDRAFT_199598, partial [Auricularia subglabra TFB-10046 SS5]
IPRPNGVAVLAFNNDDVAQQVNARSRGKCKFYQLYGIGHGAGAMTAWAWDVSRILDAPEATPAGKIDPKRVSGTGCSGNGKGAFESRIALTIPQEPGSGGAACLRLSDWQRSRGKDVHTASQIFSTGFNQFAGNNGVPRLPVDHHELAALVAPHGLFVIENTSMTWLGNQSTNGYMRALGQPANMAFSQVGGHEHCQFHSSQQADLNAFISKFLLNSNGDTTVMITDGGYTFNETQWIDWSVPNQLV